MSTTEGLLQRNSVGVVTPSQNPTFTPQATAPTSPVKGMTYVDTATGHLWTYNGATWVDNGSGGGGSGTTVYSGRSTLDFGSFPGTSFVETVVTGQTTITTGSVVNAWLIAEATADHTVYEHAIMRIQLRVGSIVVGTGFTIYGLYDGDSAPDQRVNALGAGSSNSGFLTGLWSVAWNWS